MSLRRSIGVLVVSVLVALVHLILVQAMAEGHVAHVLLGAGNGAPPLGAALLALALVVARLAVVVVVPGAALAALASILAHVAVGPLQGDGDGDGDGNGTISGAGISVADGIGASIEGRGTK